MEIQALLNQAEKCKTDADSDALLATLKDLFGGFEQFANIPVANEEAYVEEGKPFVRFELNRLYSEFYITMIRPEIRFGELSLSVVTNFMKDGLGMQSKNWEAVEGMDDVIVGRPGQTAADVAELALQCALANHQELLERLGVPTKAAKEAAVASW